VIRARLDAEGRRVAADTSPVRFKAIEASTEAEIVWRLSLSERRPFLRAFYVLRELTRFRCSILTDRQSPYRYRRTARLWHVWQHAILARPKCWALMGRTWILRSRGAPQDHEYRASKIDQASQAANPRSYHACERPRDFQGDSWYKSMFCQHGAPPRPQFVTTLGLLADRELGEANKMGVYALILVVLGSGNLGSTPPFRVAHYHSLKSCETAAHEATTSGFDNRSLGFVFVRVYGDTKQARLE